MTIPIVIAGLDPAIHRNKTAGESPPFFVDDSVQGALQTRDRVIFEAFSFGRDLT
jgi:hypothetical protein